MFFTFANLHLNNAKITVDVSHNDETLSFVVGTVISSRSKDDLRNPNQFLLLNNYLEYKGKEFQDKLWVILKQADEDIIGTIHRKESYPPPLHLIHPILDMFDLGDVLHFIKYIARVQAPSDLHDSFDPQTELDGIGSRVQTYIKDDYLELASVCVILKAAIGPICHYGYIKKETLLANNIEYCLLYFITEHPLFETPPMVKLLGFVDKIINKPIKSGDDGLDNVRVFEKGLPSSELQYYLLGILIFQKLAIATILDDRPGKNVVTTMFNYGNNKIETRADTSKTLRDKKALTDNEAGNGDKESIFESSRILADHSAGTQIELNMAVRDVPTILQQLSEKQLEAIKAAGKDTIHDAVGFSKHFLTGGIDTTQVCFLSILFKNIINPRALEYVNIQGITSLQAVGFTLLWGMGYKSLALYLTSKKAEIDQDTLSINNPVNRSRVPKEIKDELDILFPYKRVINNETAVNVADEWINSMANNIYNTKWLPMATEPYLSEGMTEGMILTPNIKIEIGRLLIDVERLING